MPSLKVKKPSAEQLAKFAASVAAAPGGTMSASPALQGHKAISLWLASRGDYLPPELAALGLTCERSGRGHRYTCAAPKATNSAQMPGKKRDGAKALEARDWEWFAKQLSPIQWAAIAKRLEVAGTMSDLAFLEPYKGSDVVKAIQYHPEKLPPQLAALGVVYDPRTYSYTLI